MHSSLATDQPRFYTLVTALLASGLLTSFKPAELAKRIATVAEILDGSKPTPRSLKKPIDEYKELAAKQTTHPDAATIAKQYLLTLLNQYEYEVNPAGGWPKQEVKK